MNTPVLPTPELPDKQSEEHGLGKKNPTFSHIMLLFASLITITKNSKLPRQQPSTTNRTDDAVQRKLTTKILLVFRIQNEKVCAEFTVPSCFVNHLERVNKSNKELTLDVQRNCVSSDG